MICKKLYPNAAGDSYDDILYKKDFDTFYLKKQGWHTVKMTNIYFKSNSRQFQVNFNYVSTKSNLQLINSSCFYKVFLWSKNFYKYYIDNLIFFKIVGLKFVTLESLLENTV